jgi:hypothetical protein
MRRGFTLISGIAALTAMSMAQDHAEYKTWMKSIPPSVGAIRNATDNGTAASDATKLADTFEKVARPRAMLPKRLHLEPETKGLVTSTILAGRQFYDVRCFGHAVRPDAAPSFK